MARRRIALLATMGLATLVGVFAAPSAVHAGEAPSQCTVPNFPSGAQVGALDLPSCNDIDGLCIEFQDPVGPARAVHAGRALPAGAVIEPPDHCASFGPACTVLVQPPNGPSRAAHATPSRALPAGGYQPGQAFTIPPECLDLPDSGFEVAPVLLAGLTALGAGLAITGLRRRFA